MTTKEIYAKNMITAIMRGVEDSKVCSVVQALYDGGIRQVEYTFNQSAPETAMHTGEIIAMLNKEFGDRMLIGAGTVMTEEQCRIVYDNGAKFILSPDMNEDIIRLTKKLGMLSIPGCYTPTECVKAYNSGADFIKLFPVTALGPDTVKALTAPLSHIPFLAVGGVDADNMLSFAKAGCVGFGIGGKLVDKNAIKANDFAQITNAASACCEILKKEGLLK